MGTPWSARRGRNVKLSRSSRTTSVAGTKRRLVAQQIARHDLPNPGAVVAWLGAVQAQDYAAAKWAVGLRLGAGATDAAIERALDDGTIVRTHALRGTWQLVAPANVRWLLALVAPRVLARAARRHHALDIDAATVRKCRREVERALAGGAALTRGELAAVLAAGGVSPAGQRLPHLLAQMELDAIICSGPRRGKQSTHMLLDERVPPARALTNDEALAELARCYFHSRGPATLRDFVWWSGLPTADARAGLDAVRTELASHAIGGETLWFAEAAARAPRRGAYLLPAFDEYLVAYRDRAAVLDPKDARRINAGGGVLDACIVIGGRVRGTWRRTLAAKRVTVTLEPFDKPGHAAEQALAAAARRYGAFLAREARIVP
jgi:hypothetical protein